VAYSGSYTSYDLIFSGNYTQNNVTMVGAFSPPSMTFQTNNYVVSATSGSLSLPSGGTLISVASGLTTTLTCGITGNGRVLTVSGGGTADLRGSFTNGSMTLGSGTLYIANASAIGSGTFTINGGTIDNTTGAPLSLTNSQVWNGDFTFTGTNDLSFSGSVSAYGPRQVSVSAHTLTMSNTLTLNASSGGSGGSGGLAKAGNGELALDGAIYSGGGPVAVNAGTLNLTGGSTYLPNGTVVTVGNGAQLTTNVGQTIGGLSGNGTLIRNGSAALTVNTGSGGSGGSSWSGTFGGVISGSGPVTLNGVGKWTLTGSNTYTGSMTISGGTLNINADAALGSGSLVFAGGTLQAGANNINLAAGRTITINSGATATIDTQSYGMTVAAVIGGSGNLTKIGSGSLTLSAVNTFGGTGKSMTLSAGTLNINNASALGSSSNSFVIGAGTTIGNSSGNLVTTSNYAQTWQGNFTFTGSNDLNLGTGAVTLSANRQVTVSASTLTVGGVVSGAGYSLTKAGSGTLIVTGANTYSGGTTLSGGELSISGDSNIGGSAMAVTFSGGVLQVTGTTLTSMGSHTVNWSSFNGGFDIADSGNTFTVSNVIAGTGSPSKFGAGTLVVSATNTYSGTTTVYAGTLKVTGSIANSASTVSGGTLSGTGTTGAITDNGGTIAPATAGTVGTLNVGNLNLSGSNAIYSVDMDNTGSDLLNVTGTVTIASGAQLSVSATIRTSKEAGDVLVVIRNDSTDAVSGSFAGLPEGSTITANGVAYGLTYCYNAEAPSFGNGNDVALVALRGAPPITAPIDTSNEIGSPASVLYGSGAAVLSADDLGLGVTRTYNSLATAGADLGAGNGWQLTSLPYLVNLGGRVVAVMSPTQSYLFGISGDTLTAQLGSLETMAHDTTNGLYKLTLTDGTVYAFDDFSHLGVRYGQLRQIVSPSGDVATALLNVDGTIWSLQSQLLPADASAVTAPTGAQPSTSTYPPRQIEEFTYYSSGENAGRLEWITLQGWNGSTQVNTRQVTYTYYGSSDSQGLLGDLQTATEQYWDSGTSTWTGGDTYYYRYYIDSADGKGFAHGLKLALAPQEYANANATLGTISSSTSESSLETYAGNYFEYSSSQQVTKGTVGGLYSYTYGYTAGLATNGYNAWKLKAVETAPDSSTYTVYSNYLGEILLTDLAASSNHWRNDYQYGTTSNCNEGQLILHANPSAVAGYVDNGGSGHDLVATLNTSAGLIEEYFYASSTTAGESTAGNVQGYETYASLYHGSGDASPTEQVSYQYFQHSAGSGVNARTVHPLASMSVYPDGSTADTTRYTYTWYSGTVQIQQEATALPIVTTGQNGPGGTDGTDNWKIKEVFDKNGNLVWEENANARFTYHAYGPVTGLLTETIADASSNPGSISPPDTLPGSGVNATTVYTRDDPLGRVTETRGPAFVNDAGTNVYTVAWTSYHDTDHEVRTASGYKTVSGGTYTLVNPISITRYDLDERVTDQIEAGDGTTITVSGTLTDLDSVSFASSTTSYPWCRWTHNDYAATADTGDNYHAAGDLIDTGVFVDIQASTPVCVETFYRYDSMGRLYEIKDTSFTITKRQYDVRGQLTAVYVGTSDGTLWPGDSSVPASNLVEVTSHQYDSGSAGGDGVRTQTKQYLNASGSSYRTTSYAYDWRDRLTTTTSSDGTTTFIDQNTLDNLGNVTQTTRYHGSIANGNRISDETFAFDNLGRLYQTTVIGVDPSTGNENAGLLVYNTWYDPAGNVIKTQAGGTGEFTKTQYDGLGRPTAVYVGFDTSESSHSSAGNVTGDTILTQTNTQYDAAGDATLVTTYDRYDSASTSDTGALDALGGTDSRASYVAYWFDGIGRQTAVQDFGAPASAPTRGSSAPSTDSNGATRVSLTAYNARGEAWDTFDPAGNETRATYDDSGQLIETIRNYSATSAPDKNITTDYYFDSYHSGNEFLSYKKVTTTNPDSTTQSQITAYISGTGTPHLASAAVYRNNLVCDVIYGVLPSGVSSLVSDVQNGTLGGLNLVQYQYDSQGEVTSMTDQNGTTHSYTYDGLGRKVSDAVTTLGSGVDNGVLRIDTAYALDGNVASTTSYSSAGGGSGNIVNQVADSYNAFGLLTDEQQAVSSQVGTGTPDVQYSYSTNSATPTRLTGITYPNGRQLTYGYNSGTDTAVGRVSYLLDGNSSAHLVDYLYLGLGKIDDVSLAGPGVDYNLGHKNTSGILDRVDQFGQVTDQIFAETGGNVDEIEYGYDVSGNRKWKAEVTAASNGAYLDELYGYDHANQLTSLTRGQLSTDHASISAHEDFAQSWTLDGMGNWSNSKIDNNGDGTWEVNQDRATNAFNEITSIGSSWATPAYNSNGNMTTVPQPGSETTGLTCKYDAWNHLVSVASGSTTLATYSYDGFNRRITETASGHTRAYYYSVTDQVLEERVDSSTSADRQNVWGLRYVDDLVLRDRATGSGGDLGKNGSGLGERLFALQDANWNVVALVNTSSAVQERFIYTAYGKATGLNADFTAYSGSTDFKWTTLFAGREVDALTGLYYNRARWYNPSLGTFVTKDPIAADSNTYRYAGGNPVDSTDPSGMVTPTIVIWIDKSKAPPDFNFAAVAAQIKTTMGSQLVKAPIVVRATTRTAKELGLEKGGYPGKKGYSWKNQGVLWNSRPVVQFEKHVEFVPGAAFVATSPWPSICQISSSGASNQMILNSANAPINPTMVYSNVIIHETFWLGVLGHGDAWWPTPGTLDDRQANATGPQRINRDQADAINDAMQ
jgi:RHS repeat-associated protein